MGSHHDHNDHHSNEKKPVSFTVPLIFASVVVLIIVLFVSLGDPKHGKCHCPEGKCTEECMKACEEGGSKKEACCEKDGAHAAHMNDHEAHATENAKEEKSATPAADSTAANSEHKEESHH